MAPMASIHDPDCDCEPGLSQSDAQSIPVSVVSAGVAYQNLRTARQLVDALTDGTQRWQSAAQGLVDLRQLHEAAALPTREARKLDRFSLLALAAAKEAIHGSKLDSRNLSSCGIYSGNMMGGWTFTEPQVRALHRDGLEAVSPYLATAWFPGAPQGQISIHLGLVGFAKTVTTDRCSGAQAIGLAFDRMKAGLKPGLLLAGGAEAPITPFVSASLAQILDRQDCAVEGAAYLLLAAGGAGKVQLRGHSTFSIDARLPDVTGRLLSKTVAMLQTAGVTAPVLILCNMPLAHELEDKMANRILDAFGQQVEVFFTTRVFGDALAASGPLACVAACEMLTQRFHNCAALVLSLGHQCADLLLFTRSGGQVS